MTIHIRYTFEKHYGNNWQPVEMEDIHLGDTIRFYDAGNLAFHNQTKSTEWFVDEDMIRFVADLIEDVGSSGEIPVIEPLGTEISASSYKEAFEWIMARMRDGDMETLNKLYESYDPAKHSAEFMSGLLRCGNSQKRRLPAWLPALKKVTAALGEEGKGALIGMDPEKIEKELAAETKPDELGSMFDRQILNVHPNLVRG